MVYGFVRQSGGHARIYSEPGQGTTVKLYLPRIMGEEQALPPAVEGPVDGGSETILVAEDDEGVRETVVEMLTELGYRVRSVGDAAEALALIESGVPIDLLFTDVVMPGPLKSPELARRVRERFPGMGVLFTSGYTENSIVHGGKLDAGVELLSKPYSREALAHKVRLVLDGRTAAPRPPKAAAAPTAAGAGPGRPGQSLAVLLVEDEWLIRVNTAEMLTEMGHRVIEAGSAEAALAAIETDAPDLLITDIGLPDLSGGELALAARRLRPGLAVIFATGREKAISTAGLEDAVFLNKPYDSSGLARAVTAAMAAMPVE
jgi:CheY-like chemotaxis protein